MRRMTASPPRYPSRMHIIYRSPRVQNAEQIAALLEEAGIATRVIHGPRHRRNTWRSVDYNRGADDKQGWPGVMIVNNGDLPQARALLRESGLIEPSAAGHWQEATATTEVEVASDAAPAFDRPSSFIRPPDAPAPTPRRNWPGLIRVGLIAILLIVATVQMVRYLY